MRLALLALALLPFAAIAKITITTPSASAYWVQNTSNMIAWTYNQGDPSSVDVLITNQNNATLNGAFSIARGVPVSQESFTVTDVTLRTATGYQVSFVDPNNATNVLAQSAQFEVKAPGTSPAPTTAPTSGSTSANGTASGSAASSATATASSSNKSNAALGLVADASSVSYVYGIVALGSFFF